MAFSKRNSIYSENFSTMILSAGLGERFRPHTTILPKPAIPFLNIPFLHYSIHLAEELGTEKIIINTHHLPNAVQSIANSTPKLSADLVFTSEQPVILGSAGGIKNAQNYLEGSGSFLTLNADTVFLVKDPGFFTLMRKKLRDTGALAILALTEHPKVGSLYNGVWVDGYGNIRTISKSPPTDSKNLRGLHFTGLQLLNDEIFPLIPQKPCDIFRDILLPAINEGQKVLGVEVPGLWFEGGSLSGYLEETKKFLDLLSGQTTETIKNFNGSNYCESIFKRFWSDYNQRSSILDNGNSLIDRSARIDSTVIIDGFTVIGANAEVGPNCKLKNCVLGPNVRLKPESSLENDLIIV